MSSINKVLEEIRLSHIPLPPPHTLQLNSKVNVPYCDLATRVITLNPLSKSIEWDYRHEIEHLNKWPRRLKEEFKHYYKALKLLPESDKKFFRKYRYIIANIVYDAFIDYELSQKYPMVKEQIKAYLRASGASNILDEARKLAVEGKKAKWLNEEKPWLSFIHVFKWIKKHGVPRVRRDYRSPVSPEEVAEAVVELVDEGEDEKRVLEEAERLLKKPLPYDKIVEALIKSRFNFAVKMIFECKIAVKAVRKTYGIWRLGEPVDQLLVRETVRSYGIVIPSHNTLKEVEVEARKGVLKKTRGGARVALVVDSSGSMSDYLTYARDAALMLIGFAKKYEYPVLLVTFNSSVPFSSKGWRKDYFKLAKEFVYAYGAGGNTYITPALREVLRYAEENTTVYIISDMDIHDIDQAYSEFRKLSSFKPKLVLFLISPSLQEVEEVCHVVKQAGVSDVKGYWVNPREAKKLTEYVIKEIIK
ncbi:MAG: hypothetical protein DRN04_13705 [Thermoprotei archaeon]|nr:MAG: hypothetical protein DRN04_13705 [Thermoprotei archaeon]